MALLTSAEAAKELKKLNDQLEALVKKEGKTSIFEVTIQENADDVRPAYDFKATQEEIERVEKRIRRLKHAINSFNLTQEVPGFGMTIDQMLIYIPQLTSRRKKLEVMRGRLPKERNTSYSRYAAVVEYSYSNYDIEEAEAEFLRVADELARAQNALDTVNATVKFEADF